MKRNWFSGLILVLLLASATPSFAQIVTRKTGEQARGNLVSMSKTELVIKPQVGDQVTIPANEIAFVEWPGEPPDVKLARGFEQNGFYDRALERYETALGNATEENLKKSLSFVVARANAGLAKGDPTKLDAAIQRLEQFKSANANHYRYYDATQLLGELYMQKGDAAKAEEAFTELGKAPWKDYQMLSQIQQGKLQLSQNKIDQALTIFQQVAGAEAENPAQKARKIEAMLGQAECLYQQKNYQQALTVLNDVTKSADESEESLHAQAYLKKGDCLLAEGKDKDALMAYLHVDMLFNKQPTLHAESLYQLSQLWGKVGKPTRADEAKARLKQDYPGTEWAKKLGG